MSVTTGKLLTAEEFILLPDLPDGSRQELVCGLTVTTPASGGMHGVCCSRIGHRIGNFVEANYLNFRTFSERMNSKE